MAREQQTQIESDEEEEEKEEMQHEWDIESRNPLQAPSRSALQPPGVGAAPSVWPSLGALAMQTARPKTQAASHAAFSASSRASLRPQSASTRRQPPSLPSAGLALPRPSSASSTVNTRAVRRNLARSSAAWAAALAQDPVIDYGITDIRVVAPSSHSGDGSESTGNGTLGGGGSGKAGHGSADFYNRDGIPHPVALRRSIVVSEAVNVEAALADLGVDYAGLQSDPAAAGRMTTSEADPAPRLMAAREAGTDRAPPSDEELRAEIHAGTFISRPAVAVEDRERWLESALLREAEPAVGRGKGVDEAALRRLSGVRRDVCVPLQLFDDESLEHRTPHEWMALATPRPNEVEWLGKRVPTDPRVLATRRREERAKAACRVQAAQRGARARQEHRQRVQLARQQEADKRAMDGAIRLRVQARRRSMRREADQGPAAPTEPAAVEDRAPRIVVIATVEYADASDKGGGDNDNGGMCRVQLRPCVRDAASAVSFPIPAPKEEEGGVEPPAPAISSSPVTIAADHDAARPAASQPQPNVRATAALAAFAAAGANRGAEAALHAATNAHDAYADLVLYDATGIVRPTGGGQLQGKALLWYRPHALNSLPSLLTLPSLAQAC